MSDDRYRDDALREIDGESSPQESAALKRRLAADPAARKEFEDMAALSRLLDGVDPVEPPADLKANIIKAVRRRERILRGFKPRPEPSFLARFLGLFESGGVRFAAALGLIAVAVVSIALMKGSPRVDTPDLLGAMAPRIEPVVDSRRLELNGVRGVVDTRVGADRTLVEVRIEADHPVRLDVLASPANWSMESETAPEDILQRADRWTIQHEGNRLHRFILKSGAPEAPFRLRITSGDEVSDTDLGAVSTGSSR